MQLAPTIRFSALSSNWVRVSQTAMPVDWLKLHENGVISITGKGSWRQEDVILSDTLEGWSFRKRPGIGQLLVLIHPDSHAISFRYDASAKSWFYKLSTISVSQTEYPGPPDQADDIVEDVAGTGDSDQAKTPCLIAEQLFTAAEQPQFTIGGFDGLTFYLDGRVSYQDRIFGYKERISDYRCENIKLNRPRGKSSILEVTNVSQRRTCLFSYHVTPQHPGCRMWYRWLVCEEPSAFERLKSIYQHAMRTSFCLRGIAQVLQFLYCTLYSLFAFVLFFALIACLFVSPLLALLLFFVAIPFFFGDRSA